MREGADHHGCALKRYGVTMTRSYNEAALGNVSPHYTWTFDPEKVRLTGQEITKQLAETRPVSIGATGGAALPGRPEPNWTGPYADAAELGESMAGIPGAPNTASLRAGRAGAGGSPNIFGFSTWMLKDGEEKYIANRLVEIFSAAVIPGAVTTSGKKPAAKKS